MAKKKITPVVGVVTAVPPVMKTVGRPSTLRDRIELFVKEVASIEVTDNTALKARVRKMWKDELALYKENTDATKKLYTSKYRKALLTELGEEHPSLSVVKLSAKIMTRIRTEYFARVATQHKQLVGIPQWVKLIETSTRLIKSDDPLMIGIGLFLLTGRRPYEVFCTGSFYPAKTPGFDSVHKWRIFFHGQIKTREALNTRHDSRYMIPVLAPARTILDAIQVLRSSQAGRNWMTMDGTTFNDKMGNLISKAMFRSFIEHWPQEEEGLTPYSMRSLYAEIAYKNFGPPTISKSAFFSRILGHRSQDIETSLSYFRFFLPEDGPNINEREIKRLQTGATKRAHSREELDAWRVWEEQSSQPASAILEAHERRRDNGK
jgi:hypothetical protein